MSNVLDFPSVPTRPTGGDGGGGDSMLEQRVGNLEKELGELRTDVAIIKSNYATKEDLHKEIAGQTKWIAGMFFAATFAVIGAIKFLI